jgi:excisionase family DNA binding protein
MVLAKMRTAQQVYDYLHKEDPESSVSLWYIRSLVKQGKIPVVKAGTKYLINLDKFMEFLNSVPIEEDDIPFNDYGKIRRVME